MSEEKSRGAGRTRNWNIIVYPESAPENWRDIVDETRIEWVASPLHDKDVDPDGTIKKSHWHVLLLFEGVKTYEQVKEVADRINAPVPVKCQSVKGSIRYMAHKDHPDKFQYNWNDIVCYGGADLSALCAPTATERLQIQKDILSFIRDNGLDEFSDLIDSIEKMKNDEWLNVALNYSTISINAYLRSRRHKAEKSQRSEST